MLKPYMWMKRLVTLSREGKTRELRQVMMALARGPGQGFKHKYWKKRQGECSPRVKR